MSVNCERARRWVSLRLDGELSELEGHLLDAHLGRCAECSAFAGDVTFMTGGLRSAGIERLSEPIRIARPAKGHVRGIRTLSAAAAFLAVVGLAAVLGIANLNGGTGGDSRIRSDAVRATGRVVTDIGAAPRGYAGVRVVRMPAAAEATTRATFPGPPF
jgi:predicted anti-sigma-YlaC factor YlaD